MMMKKKKKTVKNERFPFVAVEFGFIFVFIIRLNNVTEVKCVFFKCGVGGKLRRLRKKRKVEYRVEMSTQYKTPTQLFRLFRALVYLLKNLHVDR